MVFLINIENNPNTRSLAIHIIIIIILIIIIIIIYTIYIYIYIQWNSGLWSNLLRKKAIATTLFCTRRVYVYKKNR